MNPKFEHSDRPYLKNVKLMDGLQSRLNNSMECTSLDDEMITLGDVYHQSSDVKCFWSNYRQDVDVYEDRALMTVLQSMKDFTI